jgi:hypothetical protein
MRTVPAALSACCVVVELTGFKCLPRKIQGVGPCRLLKVRTGQSPILPRAAHVYSNAVQDGKQEVTA